MTEIKHVEAITSKFVATLVGITSTLPYRNVSQKGCEEFKKCVEESRQVVLLPIQYSIEHYNEISEHIASFCTYKNIEIEPDDENAGRYKVRVAFKCEHRCKITKIEIEKTEIFVDVELLERQPFTPEHDKLRKAIYERFKEYMKYDDVYLGDIDYVKNSEEVDRLIEAIIIPCKFDVDAKRKLLEEKDATKRLEILNSSIETRIFEQRSDKDKDLFLHYKQLINALDLDADIKKIIYGRMKLAE